MCSSSVQHIEQIDKQVRTSLVEYLVTCRRLDRLKNPVHRKTHPVLHGWLHQGQPSENPGCYGALRLAVSDFTGYDRWVYQLKDLYKAYNTRQVFTDSYEHGVFSYVQPHLKGWNESRYGSAFKPYGQ